MGLLSLFPFLCFLFLSVNAQRDPPFVVNVTDVTTSTPGGATYGINSLLEFEVEFTHPVQVSNSDFLRLKLNIWRDSVKSWAQAEYIEPSSAPNRLRFVYVVKRRDFTPDYLDFYRYDAISGGVIEPNVSLCTPTGVGAVIKCPLLSSFLPPKGVASLANKKILVWGFPAFLLNVTTSAGSGLYGIGSNINITLHYSAPVTVVRQRSEVNLPLNSDITAGQLVPASATYIAGSGTNTLTFQYTVQRGHYSDPLNYPEFATLKNLVIKDANNEVDYNLPSPSASSLLASKKIVADGIPPYPAFVTSTAQYRSLFKPGQAVTVLVIFSEPIELFYYDNMKIILNIGVFPASSFSVDTVNFTFIVPNNTDTDELNYMGTGSIIPNGARVFDLARNEGSFILPPNNTEINLQGKNDYSPLGRLKIRISSTRPFFVGTQASTSGPLLPLTVFNIIIVVSENLQISGTTPGNPYLLLSDGGIANFTQSYGTGLVPGLIFTYTVPAQTTYLNTPLEIRAFVFDTSTASITNEAKLPLNATGINFDGPNLSLTSKITFVAAVGPPDAPINLTVSQVNFDSITIQWARPSDNGARIFRYQVERSTGPDNFAIDGSVEVSASDFNTVYLYTARRFLIPNQVYYFRVAAQNVVSLSGYSNVVNATIVLDR